MRVIGYLLLILGFASIPYAHYANLHAIKEQALAHAFPAGSETRTFGVNEVAEITQHALDEMGSSAPRFSYPAAVMLVGGILLDVASRRRRKATDAA